MGAEGYDRFTLTQALSRLDELDWRPLGPDSPEVGDAVRYRDGTIAVVGTSSHVSYGPREEMVAVAPLVRRDGQAEAPAAGLPAEDPDPEED